MRVKPIEVANDYELLNCNVQNSVELSENVGIYRLTYKQNTKMYLENYRIAAMKAVECYRQHSMEELGRFPEYISDSESEDLFWNDLKKRSVTKYQTSKRLIPVYAIDNELSRYPKDWKWWNLNALTPQESGLCSESVKMPGINTPYLYYAMPFTAFALHHEDSNVGSINVHHGGARRIWYSVPSSNSKELEQVCYTLILFLFLF